MAQAAKVQMRALFAFSNHLLVKPLGRALPTDTSGQLLNSESDVEQSVDSARNCPASSLGYLSGRGVYAGVIPR